MFDESLNKGRSGCERISEEEFEYHSRVTTRQEIRKLATSEAYEQHAAARGNDLAQWNWQARDKQDGIFPPNEEDVKLPGNDEVEEIFRPEHLEGEFLKADEELARLKRA